VEQVIAALAVPEEPVSFVAASLAFDDQAHGIRETLGRVRHVRGQQQDFSCTNGYIHPLPFLHRAQEHVALELMEELLTRVVVVVLARVGAAHDHDDELARVEDLLVADRWLQVGAMRLDPLLQAESSKGLHVMSISAALANQSTHPVRRGSTILVASLVFHVCVPSVGNTQVADAQTLPVAETPVAGAVVGSVTSTPATAADAPGPRAAVWIERKLKFWFTSRSTFYSCAALRDRARYLLYRVGARPDMKVMVSCLDQIGPQQMPSVRITAAVPAEATPEVLARLDADMPRQELIKRVRKTRGLYTEDPLAQFPAVWQTVTIDGRKDPYLEDGDCEFIEQFTKQVLVPLGVRIAADSRVRCVPHQVTMGSVKLKVESLQRYADTVATVQ
jgi:hypothetical protein